MYNQVTIAMRPWSLTKRILDRWPNSSSGRTANHPSKGANAIKIIVPARELLSLRHSQAEKLSDMKKAADAKCARRLFQNKDWWSLAGSNR
ncbi:hypothetical protein [Salinicola sp. DM10]|uniref:hypothetical protein n=1 Tax=Salinicola sp. DM10 TaxID=2815721 RepID=UPI001A8D75A6|nr:hypothetical protein [Salinicola sp. DM10]MCE3027425.1 hypothetical protein [Salinicola sp. DM10]